MVRGFSDARIEKCRCLRRKHKGVILWSGKNNLFEDGEFPNYPPLEDFSAREEKLDRMHHSLDYIQSPKMCLELVDDKTRLVRIKSTTKQRFDFGLGSSTNTIGGIALREVHIDGRPRNYKVWLAMTCMTNVDMLLADVLASEVILSRRAPTMEVRWSSLHLEHKSLGHILSIERSSASRATS